MKEREDDLMDDDLRDTVPALPVKSKNPIADLRKATTLELEVRKYAVLSPDPLVRDDGYFGLKIEQGIAKRVTPELDQESARKWLAAARRSAERGTVFPSFCKKGHVCALPGICERWFGGGE